MGIYDFFSKFIRTLPRGVVSSLKTTRSIEGMSFDVNAILHKVAQEVFMYGAGGRPAFRHKEDGGDEEFAEARREGGLKSYEALENEFMIKMQSEFATILSEKHVKQYVFFMIDGVAPIAKIQQQRTRRFKSAIENHALAGTDGEPLGGFSSSFISPGTPFMDVVANNLAAWINSNRGKSLPQVVVLSTGHVPGEGEHKIFQTMRDLIRDGTIIQGTDPHVIWSLDSDLAILSALSEDVRNIHLARQIWTEVIVVEGLRKEIIKFMKGDATVVPTAEEHSVLCDFAVISNVIGNDFLPRSVLYPVFTDTVVKAYRAVEAPLTERESPESDTHTIINQNLGIFFWHLSQTEAETANDIREGEIRDEGTRNQRIAPTATLRSAVDEETGQIFDHDKFINNYYADIRDVFIKTDLNKKLTTASVPLGALKESVASIYCYGFEWVLRYYTGGGKAVNWTYSYPYINAGLPSDISATLLAMAEKRTLMSEYTGIKFAKSEAFGVTENDGPAVGRGATAISMGLQLLIVIPNPVLVSAFRRKVFTGKNEYLSLTGGKPKGPLAVLSPPFNVPGLIEFYSAGKYKEFQTVPLIPRYNYASVKRVFDKLDEGKIGAEDKKIEDKWRSVNKEALALREHYESEFVRMNPEKTREDAPVDVVWEGEGWMPYDVMKKAKTDHVPPKLVFKSRLRKMKSYAIPEKLQISTDVQIIRPSFSSGLQRTSALKPPVSIIGLAKKTDDAVVVGLTEGHHSLVQERQKRHTADLQPQKSECSQYKIISTELPK